MKNLTYDQLIELAPKDRPFQIEVESNPYGEGKKQILWACSYRESKLDTCLLQQHDINGIRYSYGINWIDTYTGTFTLIDEYRNMYEKPEVLKVGQKVRIMESARDCGDYDYWEDARKQLVGTTGIIDKVVDDDDGIAYWIDKKTYPHYCVIPVEEEEPERTLEDILSELSDTDKEIIKSKLK